MTTVKDFCAIRGATGVKTCLLYPGEGPVADGLAAAAVALGIQPKRLYTRPPGCAGSSEVFAPPALTGPDSSPPIVLTRLDLPAGLLNFLMKLEQASNIRLFPSIRLSGAAWNTTSLRSWLRKHGLPADSIRPPGGNPVPDAGDEHGAGCRFIVPVVHDLRGNTVMLPNFTRKPAPSGCLVRKEHSLNSLSPGLRRRYQAVAACTAEKLATSGLAGVELMITAEDAVVVTDLIAFPAFVSAIESHPIAAALTRIHLAAVMGLPLPDFFYD